MVRLETMNAAAKAGYTGGVVYSITHYSWTYFEKCALCKAVKEAANKLGVTGNLGYTISKNGVKIWYKQGVSGQYLSATNILRKVERAVEEQWLGNIRCRRTNNKSLHI